MLVIVLRQTHEGNDTQKQNQRQNNQNLHGNASFLQTVS